MMNQTITKLLILLMTIISNPIKLIYILKEILKENKNWHFAHETAKNHNTNQNLSELTVVDKMK